MKKVLWFLVGMAIIISIPIMLFSPGTPTREAPSKALPQKEIGIREHQSQKPGTVSDARENSIKGAQKIDSRK